MPVMWATGWMVVGLALPVAGETALPPIVVHYRGNNGSLPPPHRRSTEISIDATGCGHYRRQHGYDSNDPHQRFETAFTVDASAVQRFSRRMLELRAMDLRWSELAHPPVGGSVVMVRLTQGGRVVDVPAFPVQSQQEVADAIRAAVRDLLPESVHTARALWERGRADQG